MPASFHGLDVALRGLRAQQTGLDVVNHNIANANTPGFSRQTASLATTSPYTVPNMNRDPAAGQLGTGVAVTAIRRQRDSFVDYQLRNEVSTHGRWQAAGESLEQVEAIFNEPSTSGLNTLLNRFWQSWQELAGASADPAVRANLVEQARALTAAFGHKHQQLQRLQEDADRQIVLMVEEINSMATRIADLNAQIAQVAAAGQQPNDLSDRRDLLLDQLANFARVRTATSPNGAVEVFVGNRALVSGTTFRPLRAAAGAGGLAEVQWAGDGAPMVASNGRLKGLIEQRDVTLPRFMAELDELAERLITTVNAAHAAGFGLDDVGPLAPNRAFFTGSGAAGIAVDDGVATNVRNIAAATRADAPGDGAQALAVAQALKSAGVDTAYQSFIARLGVEARAAAEKVENQDALVEHLKRRREALSGVSLDEETVNLLKYQQAYEASARVMTAVDQMLDVLINRMGMVGR